MAGSDQVAADGAAGATKYGPRQLRRAGIVADNIGDQDRSDLPGLGHWTLGPSWQSNTIPDPKLPKALKEPRTPARPP